MLPPVDPNILQRNRSFDILYKDLCTRKLNPDGSTRDTKKQRIHDEIRRNLKHARTTLYTSQILLQTLSSLPQKSSTLPDELHAVIELVTAQLSGHIPTPDREILAGDIDFFLDNISTISEAISAQLTTVVDLLCRVANPMGAPEASSLATRAEKLMQDAEEELPKELGEAKLELANTAYGVLSIHRLVLETSIKILEQTMHGSLARAAKAKAELLHSRATLLELQARIHTLTHPPPAEFVAALKNFKASQGSTESSLKDREELAKKALELYDKAGEKAMRDIARRATYLQQEIRQTKEEIEKLERGED